MKQPRPPVWGLSLILPFLITACTDNNGDRETATAQASQRVPASVSSQPSAPQSFIDPHLREAAPMRIRAAAVTGGAEPAWDNRTRNDFNGDGRSDILWYHASLPAAGYWTMNGAGVLGAAAFWTATGYRIVGSGDFDGDGRHDLLWDHVGNHALYLWRSRSDGGFDGAYLASYGTAPTGGTWIPSLIADLNGDRKPDIAWRSPIGNEFTVHAVWLMDGVNVSGSALATWYTPVAAADLIGLGRDQIINTFDGTGSSGLSFLWYRPDGAFVEYFNSRISQQPFSANSRVAGSADVNADGIQDVVWRDDASGLVEIWTMGRTGSGDTLRAIVQNTAYIPTDSAYRIASIGDFDGDGFQDDVLWRRAASNELFLWFGRGDGGFASSYVGDHAPGWTILP